jgi:hypothetical protein
MTAEWPSTHAKRETARPWLPSVAVTILSGRVPSDLTVTHVSSRNGRGAMALLCIFRTLGVRHSTKTYGCIPGIVVLADQVRH